MDVSEQRTLWWPFFWLSAFYFVYCARPGDWTHFLNILPFAKITGTFAVLSLLMSAGRAPRSLRDLPREGYYLFALISLLFASALLSPLWRGGAFFVTLAFCKVYVAWLLTFMLVTNLKQLQRIIFIQTISVAVVSIVAVIKGHNVPRLSGVIGGIYSNSNDLAFAIVLSLPFCLAFMVGAESVFRKLAWCVCALAMAVALSLTASRGGFIDLIISGGVCMWEIGIKGRRFYLIFVSVVVMGALFFLAGSRLQQRFTAMFEEDTTTAAYGSYAERKYLMDKAVDAIEQYPLLGVGAQNFAIYSGIWQEVHASYLEIAAEGGIVSLILYLMFFYRGFANLRSLRKYQLSSQGMLLVGALRSSLIGFVVGACFAPEAYQYFPYFAVCYTSLLVTMNHQNQPAAPVVRFTSLGHRVIEGQCPSESVSAAF